MRRLLLLLALTAACGADEGSGGNAARPAGDSAKAAGGAAGTGAQAAAERGTFTLSQDTLTIIERFSRTPERLESELAAEGQERLVQELQLNPDASVRRMEVRIYEAGAQPGAQPAERLVITFDGDSATAEGTEGGQTQRQRFAAPGGPVPIPVEESAVMLEQVLMRARKIGGEQVQVPIISGEGEIVNLSVTFTGPGQARVEAEGTRLDLRTDAQGRLLSGSNEGGNLTIRRTPTP